MKTVLLIEDDAQLRKLLRIHIEKMRFQLFEAQSGLEGMRLMTMVAPDIVITDIVIPDKDGLEIIKEIKAEDETVTIIAISGENGIGSTSYARLALNLGADFFLKKPIDKQELVETLRRAAGDGKKKGHTGDDL